MQQVPQSFSDPLNLSSVANAAESQTKHAAATGWTRPSFPFNPTHNQFLPRLEQRVRECWSLNCCRWAEPNPAYRVHSATPTSSDGTTAASSNSAPYFRVTRTYTYGALMSRALRVAHHMVTVERVNVGDRVILCFPFTLDFIVAFLATVLAGATAVPIYPPDPTNLHKALPKMTSLLRQCSSESKLILTHGQLNMFRRACALNPFSPKWDDLGHRWLAIDDLINISEQQERECYLHPSNVAALGGNEDALARMRPSYARGFSLTGTALCFLQFTSGSTGDPKGVCVSLNNVFHNLVSVESYFLSLRDAWRTQGWAAQFPEAQEQVEAIRSGRFVFFSWLPPFHDFGLIACYLLQMSMGGEGIYMSPIDFITQPLSWLHGISQFKATISGGPNFGLELMARRFEDAVRKQLPNDPARAQAYLSGLQALSYPHAGEPNQSSSVPLKPWSKELAALAVEIPELRGINLSPLMLMPVSAEPVRFHTLRRFLAYFGSPGLTFNNNSLAISPVLGGSGSIKQGYGFRELTYGPCWGCAENVVGATERATLSLPAPVNFLRVDKSSDPLVSAGTGWRSHELDVRIVDTASGLLCPPNTTGELWVWSPSTASGYYGAKELSHERFGAHITGSPDGWTWMRSGDEALITQEGHLFITGRIKDLLIQNGVKLYPQDLEVALETKSAPAVLKAIRPGCSAAFSTDHRIDRFVAKWVKADRIVSTMDHHHLRESHATTERICMAIEVREHARPPNRAGWIELAKQVALCLSTHGGVSLEPGLLMIAFMQAKSIPKTSSGKLRRSALRISFEQLGKDGADKIAHAKSLQKKVEFFWVSGEQNSLPLPIKTQPVVKPVELTDDEDEKAEERLQIIVTSPTFHHEEETQQHEVDDTPSGSPSVSVHQRTELVAPSPSVSSTPVPVAEDTEELKALQEAIVQLFLSKAKQVLQQQVGMSASQSSASSSTPAFSAHSNLFELGGSSQTAALWLQQVRLSLADPTDSSDAQLPTRLWRSWGDELAASLNFSLLFEAATFQELARILVQRTAEMMKHTSKLDNSASTTSSPAVTVHLSNTNALPAPLEANQAATCAQRQIWLAERMTQLEASNADSSRNTRYNCSRVWHLEIPANSTDPTHFVDWDGFHLALIQLAKRHTALRTALRLQEADGSKPSSNADPQLMQHVLPSSGLNSEVVTFRVHYGLRLCNSDKACSVLAEEISQASLTPFDVSNGPLWRCEIWHAAVRSSSTLASERVHCMVMFSAHHSCCDLTSFPILMNEISELYAAQVARRPAVLASLPCTFQELAALERNWLGDLTAASISQLIRAPTIQLTPSQQQLSRVANYWSKMWKNQHQYSPAPFAIDLGHLSMSADSQHQVVTVPNARTEEHISVSVKLSDSLSARIRAWQRSQHAITPFSAFLALFSVFLWRLSREQQTDLAIMAVHANRYLPQMQTAVGMLANTVVYPVQLQDALRGISSNIEHDPQSLQLEFASRTTLQDVQTYINKLNAEVSDHSSLPWEYVAALYQDTCPDVQARNLLRCALSVEESWQSSGAIHQLKLQHAQGNEDQIFHALPFHRTNGTIMLHLHMSCNPQVDTMLHAVERALTEESMEDVDTSSSAAPFSAIFDFDPLLLSRSAVQEIADRWIAFLDHLLPQSAAHQSMPSVPLTQASILLPNERNYILPQLSSKCDFGPPVELASLFAEQATNNSDVIAAITPENEYSYRQLSEYAGTVAQRFISAVSPADVSGLHGRYVLQVIARGIASPTCILASWMLGAIYVPLSASDPPQRLAELIAELYAADQQKTKSMSGTMPIIVTRETASQLQAALNFGHSHQMWPSKSAPQLLLLDSSEWTLTRLSSMQSSQQETHVLAAASMPTHSPASPSDIAYCVFTSGSTGHPKRVEISHANFFNLVRAAEQAGVLNRDDRLFATAAATFDIHVLQTVGPLLVGASVMLPEVDAHRDIKRVVELIHRHKCTVFDGVPSFFATVKAYCEENAESRWSLLQSLRLVIFGGESLEVAFIHDFLSSWHKHNPESILNAVHEYGPAECTHATTFHHVKYDSHEASSQVSAAGTILPLGLPFGNYDVFVLDRWGCQVAPGQSGELFIGGNGRFNGYPISEKSSFTGLYSVPSLISQTTQQLYRTGDYVDLKVSADSSVNSTHPVPELYFAGRRDEQLKLRGIRMDASEIARCILKATLIDGQRIVSHCIVQKTSKAGSSDSSLEVLVAHCIPNSASSDFSMEVADDKNLSWWSNTAVPALAAYVAAHLPAPQHPSFFVQYSTNGFPMSVNGKIDRKALKKRAEQVLQDTALMRQLSPSKQNTTADNKASERPANGLEVELCHVFAHCFSMSEAEMYKLVASDLTSYGGTSLIVMHVLQQLRSSFDADLNIRSVFEQPSVRDIAQLLVQRAKECMENESHEESALRRTQSENVLRLANQEARDLAIADSAVALPIASPTTTLDSNKFSHFVSRFDGIEQAMASSPSSSVELAPLKQTGSIVMHQRMEQQRQARPQVAAIVSNSAITAQKLQWSTRQYLACIDRCLRESVLLIFAVVNFVLPFAVLYGVYDELVPLELPTTVGAQRFAAPLAIAWFNVFIRIALVGVGGQISLVVQLMIWNSLCNSIWDRSNPARPSVGYVCRVDGMEGYAYRFLSIQWRCCQLIILRLIAGTPFYSWLWRMMGADISNPSSVIISTIPAHMPQFSLVTIEPHTRVAAEVEFQTVELLAEEVYSDSSSLPMPAATSAGENSTENQKVILYFFNRVQVGSYCSISERCVLMPGTKVPDFISLPPATVVTRTTNYTSFWSSHDIPSLPQAMSWLHMLFQFISILTVLFAAATWPSITAALWRVYLPDYMLAFYMLLPAWYSLWQMLNLLLLVIVQRGIISPMTKSVLSSSNNATAIPVASLKYLICVWLPDMLLCFCGPALAPLTFSGSQRFLLKVLGATVEDGAELATSLESIRIPLSTLKLRQNSFITSEVLLGTRLIEKGSWIIGDSSALISQSNQRDIESGTSSVPPASATFAEHGVEIGANTFVGNGSILSSGVRLPANMLLGALSCVTPRESHVMESESVWLGIPARRILRLTTATSKSNQSSLHEVPSQRFLFRVWHTLRPLLGLAIGDAMMLGAVLVPCLIIWGTIPSSDGGIAASGGNTADWDTRHVLLMLPVIYSLAMLVWSFEVVALKWILIGRQKPTRRSTVDSSAEQSTEDGMAYDSWYFQRTLLFETARMRYLQMVQLPFMPGTEWLNLFYRCQGAKIGSQVFLLDAVFNALNPDLLQVGHGCIVETRTALQPHSFEAARYQLAPVQIGDHCRVGCFNVVMPGAILGHGVTLQPHTLILKNDVLPSQSKWVGNPPERIKC